MRVIAGTARSLPLKTVAGKDTRPTTDRIKETIFNMLMPYIPDSLFLDLFSGSGAIGIEALSRGAKECVFVEHNRQALACIQENLRFTKLADHARIYGTDVFSALAQLQGHAPFDVIFMDPPYDRQLEQQVLSALADCSFADQNTLIVVEASLHTDFSYASSIGFSIEKEKCYKTNKHVFLRKEDLTQTKE